MNSESGQSYMDKLKAKNIPPKLQSEEPAETIPMVQISQKEWMRLMEAMQRLIVLSADLKEQRASLKQEADEYTKAMMQAAQEQTRAAETVIKEISTEAMKQVGRTSEKASEVINRRIIRDEAIWWLRLILTALPTILVLLLWACVGFTTLGT